METQTIKFLENLAESTVATTKKYSVSRNKSKFENLVESTIATIEKYLVSRNKSKLEILQSPCLLYTSPSQLDKRQYRMASYA